MRRRTKLKRRDWNKIDESVTECLVHLAANPVRLLPMPPDAVPAGILKLSGFHTAYWSSYLATQPITASTHLTAIGEYAGIRFEDDLGKAYNWIVASGSNGAHFAGPYKGFTAHTFHRTDSVAIEDVFGNTPYSPDQRSSVGKSDAGAGFMLLSG